MNKRLYRKKNSKILKSPVQSFFRKKLSGPWIATPIIGIGRCLKILADVQPMLLIVKICLIFCLINFIKLLIIIKLQNKLNIKKKLENAVDAPKKNIS